MKAETETESRNAANISMVIMLLCCLALIAAFFLLQPGSSGFGVLLFLLLLACPLMHLFMHGGKRRH